MLCGTVLPYRNCAIEMWRRYAVAQGSARQTRPGIHATNMKMWHLKTNDGRGVNNGSHAVIFVLNVVGILRLIDE